MPREWRPPFVVHIAVAVHLRYRAPKSSRPASGAAGARKAETLESGGDGGGERWLTRPSMGKRGLEDDGGRRGGGWAQELVFISTKYIFRVGVPSFPPVTEAVNLY